MEKRFLPVLDPEGITAEPRDSMALKVVGFRQQTEKSEEEYWMDEFSESLETLILMERADEVRDRSEVPANNRR